MFNLKLFIPIIIIFMFLPDCCLGLLNLEVPVFSILILFFLAVLLFLRPRKFLGRLRYIYRKTPFKYFVWFLATIMLSALLLILQGSYPLDRASHIITSCILFAGCNYLFFALTIPEYFSIKNVIKLFTIILFFILVYGLFDVTAQTLNWDFVKFIHNGFFSSRVMIWGADLNKASVISFGIHRATSVFFEPAYFAKFIFLSFPLIKFLSESKESIFKNSNFDSGVKKSLFTLAWINLLLTLSPIFIIASFMLCLYLYWANIAKFRKKNSLFLGITTIVSLTSVFLIYNSGPSDIVIFQTIQGFISRIVNVVTSIGDYTQFISVEESLATRVTAYVNSVELFLKHPLIGVGFDNSVNYMYESLIYNSSVPLTKEIIYKIQLGRPLGAVSIFYRILCETGILGTITFYMFLFKNITLAKKMQKCFSGLEKDFLTGLKICLILVVIHTFYESSIVNPYIWFFLGMTVSYYISAVINNKIINKNN